MQVSVIGNPDDTVVVTVRGDLDDGSDTVLGTTLDQVLDRRAPRVVVDVSGIGFCDSVGLRSFVTGHERAHAAGGWLRLAAAGEKYCSVFSIPFFDRRSHSRSASNVRHPDRVRLGHLFVAVRTSDE